MFETYLIQPIYNGFIYLIGVMPGGDVGLAIITLTIIVRVAFYPAFASSIRTQMGMQEVQEEIDEINKKYKDNATERARLTMELFREKQIKPLSSILALLVQLPVLLALYYTFLKEGLPRVATHLLYSFVSVPQTINTDFFGLLNLLTNHNVVLTAIVGALQYLVVYYSLSRVKKAQKTKLSAEKAAAQRMQQNIMLYFMPVILATFTYSLPGAAGLYFAVGSLISLGQEWVIRRQMGLTK